jgi:hypothetical protein
MEFSVKALLFQVNAAMGKASIEDSNTYVANGGDLQNDCQRSHCVNFKFPNLLELPSNR